MKKWILRGILAIVILFVVLIVTMYFMRNTLVRAGVVRGGEYATKLKTSLNLADLSLGGSLKLDHLDMDNINGFNGKLLVMKSCGVSVVPSTLLSHTVEIPEINIDGIELTVEQNGTSNNLNELLK